MIELSGSAKKSLEDYLRQVRTYLRWSKTADASEVEQNIAEHIENELGASDKPVSCDALNAVLGRLGSPRQWVPEEELPWWSRIIMRLSNGPEDWRLAYVSLGLLIGAGLVVNYTRPFAVVLFASFAAARAAVECADGEGGLGGRRWLVYPSLLVLYAFVLGVGLFGVFALGLLLGEFLWEIDGVATYVRMGDEVFQCIVATIVTGLWWIVLGMVSYAVPGVVRGIFRPFADRFSRRWAVGLLGVGFVVVIVLGFVLACMSGAIFR